MTTGPSRAVQTMTWCVLAQRPEPHPASSSGARGTPCGLLRLRVLSCQQDLGLIHGRFLTFDPSAASSADN